VLNLLIHTQLNIRSFRRVVNSHWKNRKESEVGTPGTELKGRTSRVGSVVVVFVLLEAICGWSSELEPDWETDFEPPLTWPTWAF